MATSDNAVESGQKDTTVLEKRAVRWQTYIDDLDNEHAALVDPSDDIIKKYHRIRDLWQHRITSLVAEINENSST